MLLYNNGKNNNIYITYVTNLNISVCAPGGMECSQGLGPVISSLGAPDIVKGDLSFGLDFLIFGILVLNKDLHIINY